MSLYRIIKKREATITLRNHRVAVSLAREILEVLGELRVVFASDTTAMRNCEAGGVVRKVFASPS